MIPKTIGRYRIKAELGRGGMSTVYLAHDPRFERDVAVKLLPLELLHQRTFRRRFEREAKVVAALDHPAIVPVYDFGEEDGQPFLVMRFMTGGSLSDRLKQGPLPVKDAARLISTLAPALDEVHAHGVVHRDLKPSNILFDQRNEPYISDFGTAKISHAHTKLTDTGGAVGTPAYMSPEQIQGEAELDGRSDIYTLGVILFEMLTGMHPYQTNTPIAVAVKHMFEPVPRLLDMEPNLPPKCQEIIVRAMAKQPEQRYPTAVSLAEVLENVARFVETGQHEVIANNKQVTSKRFALIVGNSEYDDPTLAQLIKPTANLHTLAHVLQNPDIGAFDEVTTLINEPTDVVRRSISHFFTGRQPEDILLLYFMGHAALGTRGRLYLAVKNTEHALLRGTAIPASFIADEMDNCASKQQVLVLDSYFSDSIPSEVPGLIGRAVNTGETFARNGYKRVVVTSTDSTQYNWGKEAVVGEAIPSLFTHHFVQGLLSGAADANRDGQITIDELFGYIQTQMTLNQSEDQIQVPRKWTPYSYQEGADIIIGKNPNRSQIAPILEQSRTADLNSVNGHIKSEVEPEPQPDPPLPNQVKERIGHHVAKLQRQQGSTRWLAGGAIILSLLILIVVGTQSLAEDPPTVTPNAAVLPQPTESTTVAQTTAVTKTAAPPVETVDLSPTAVLTTSPTPTLTPTVTATASPTPTATPVPMAAIAQLSSSIFRQPDADSQELTFVGVGEEVLLLGRTDSGEWLLVEDADGVQGFVHAPRFRWSENSDGVPTVSDAAVSGPTTTNTACPAGGCPTLTLNIYPLPGGRCQNGMKYRTVYLEGHGGNGVYTYYWNNQQLTNPLSEGFGFEVSSQDGSAVIGTGKVVSGDGQTVEEELFVSNFVCD